MTMADIAINVGAEHSEGPIWDVETQRLWWVDISGEKVHRFDPLTGTDVEFAIDGQPGAVAVRDSGGAVVAVPDGFALLDPDADGGTGRVTPWIAVESDKPENRMNDCKCDPLGRFWAGTMAYEWRKYPTNGALYVLGTDHSVRRLFDGAGISNGLGWSPDTTSFYYVDSVKNTLDVFDCDLAAAVVTNRRTIVEIEPAFVGDGLTVDAEGNVWVAFGRSGSVHCYSPAGELQAMVEVPVTITTSCTFGGSDLGDLYITTSWFDLPDDKKQVEDVAGAVFVCRPGVSGLAPHRYRG